MVNIAIDMLKRNKKFISFMALNYVDKFLLFALPLLVLFITDNQRMYNSVEYVYSIANIIVPFLLVISGYAFYGYKTTANRERFIESYRSYCCFWLFFLLILGCISIPFLRELSSVISLDLYCFIVIRVLFELYINCYSSYYRLKDNPSKILYYSISCSIVSVVFVFAMMLIDMSHLLYAYFIPQLILVIASILSFIKIRTSFLLERFLLYIKTSFFYCWPIVLNSILVAFVTNYGKVYAFNNMSTYDMYNFSYVMRISMVITLANSSTIAFFSKKVYLNGFTKSFILKYFFVIMVFSFLAFALILLFNLVAAAENKLLINAGVALLLLFSLFRSFGSFLELYCSRNNKNHVILIMSGISCAVFGFLILVSGRSLDLFHLDLYMFIFSLAYFVLMMGYWKYGKIK